MEMRRLSFAFSSQQFASRPRCVTGHSQRRGLADSISTETGLREGRVSTTHGTFIRHEEPTGQVWYSLKSRYQRITRPKDPKFFEISNIVLDLDAEGQRGVREFAEEDEHKMEKRWAPNQKHEAMKAVVSTLEKEATRLRHSWDQILAKPASPWRISHHDLMSVALRGVADHPDQDQSALTTQEGRPGFLHLLSQTNGIPSYAADNDRSILEWMLLRKSAMEERVAAQSDQLPTYHQFADTIENAQSLLELRRTIATCSLGSLGNEHNAIASFSSDGSISQAIQNAVVRLLGDLEPGSSQMEKAMREAMAIVANTEITLRSHQPLDSANLWTFGLQLATSHSVPAVIASLYRGLEAGYEAALPGPGQHLAESMQDLAQRLEDIAKSDHGELVRRLAGGALLKVLTGAVSVNKASAISVRSIINGANSDDTPLDVRTKMRMAYVSLLGRLGAFRTLWAEYQELCVGESGMEAQENGVSSERLGTRNAIVESVALAPCFEISQKPLRTSNTSLHSCALLDYEDLASRTMLTDIAAGPLGLVELDLAKLEVALQGDLQGWLEELARQQRGEVDQLDDGRIAAYA